MFIIWNFAAFVSTTIAIALLLLTLRQQRWLARPLTASARGAAALAAIAGLAFCIKAHGVGAGAVTWLALAMSLALAATVGNARRGARSQ